jgi:hypothetical protein
MSVDAPEGWSMLYQPGLRHRHPRAASGWKHESGATMGLIAINDGNGQPFYWIWEVRAGSVRDRVRGLSPEKPPFGWAERLMK